MKSIACPSSSRTIPLLVVAFTASHSMTHAAPSVVDSFLTGGANYNTASPLVGQGPAATGFTGNWLEAYGGAESPTVIAGGLSYTDGTNNVTVAGGAVEYPAGGFGRAGRVLTSPLNDSTSGTVYFSFMIQADSTGSGYRGVEMHNGGFDDGGNRKLQIVTGEGGSPDFVARLFNSDTNDFSGNLGVSDTNVNFFVGKFTMSTSNDGDSLQIWRNPSDLASEIQSGSATFEKTGFNLQIDRVSLARFNNTADGFKGDEIRFGNTWSDVTTVATDDDNDGLPDDYEYVIINDNALDAVTALTDVKGPGDAPSTSDYDSDGSTDAQEYVKATNPVDSDTDNDGLLDGVETNTGTYVNAGNTGTNPLDADTEDDGLLDGVENNTGTYVSASQTGTNPHTTDYDGDGENDGIEVFMGTDPTQSSSSSAAVGNPLVDGTRDALYGSAITVQTIETGFGDNQSEWNAAYGKVANGKLYLTFTGNLEANFNKLNIFIDSQAGGSTTFTSSGNDGSSAMNGMIFDSGFEPDYHLIARRGSSQFDLDMAILGSVNYSSHANVFGGSTSGRGITTTGSGNSQPIRVAYNGSNTAGIGGTAGNAADQTAAAAVTTGLEICISLADLGNPTGPIKVMLLQASNDHNYLSNQTLAGLPAGFGNLASPTTADFSTYAGDQFFSVSQASGYASWATTNAGGQTAGEDFDGDGIDNGAEYFMGTAGNAFTPNPSVVSGAVTWPRASGTTIGSFKVEVSDNLSTWQDAAVAYPANLTITGSQVVFTLPTGAGKIFARLSVTP